MRIKDLFKYRSVWMGFCIILVIWFHFPFNYNTGSASLNQLLSYIKFFVYYTVDIFFIASGIGCYLSLQKNNDLLGFFKRRAGRFFPTYYPYIVIYALYNLILFRTFSYKDFAAHVYLVDPFVESTGGTWYVTALWVSYLFAPLLAIIVKRCDRLYQKIILLTIIALLSVPFFGRIDFLLGTIRMFDFAVGMLIAKYCDTKISVKQIVIGNIIAVFCVAIMVYSFIHYDYLFLTNYGLLFYPNYFAAPIIIIDLSLICMWLEKSKIGSAIIKIYSSLGGVTLELFFTHTLIIEFMIYKFFPEGYTLRIPYAILFFALSFASAYALSWLNKNINKLMARRTA